MKNIGDLLKELESFGFQHIAGPFENAAAWVVLKEMLKDRLNEEIPEDLIREYNLDGKVRGELEIIEGD